MESQGSRISNIRKLLGLTQVAFAKSLGISQSAFSQIETMQMHLTMVKAQTLCEIYNVNANYLLSGDLPMFNTHLPKAQAGTMPVENNIPFIDQDAHAGYPENFNNEEYISGFVRYSIPGFSDGNYRMFEVAGDSMEPTLYEQEILIVEKLDKFNEFEDSQLYVVILKDGVFVKRMFHDRNGSFLLKSDNESYKNLSIKEKDILELWAVKAKLTSKFLSPDQKQQRRLKELEERIGKLEQVMMQEYGRTNKKK